MRLHQLKPAPGSRPPKRIVGRGEGSTLGQTCGKGQKGQKARSGDTIMNGFEGGQMPLFRRIPKRGFRSVGKVHYLPINLDLLDKAFNDGEEVTGETLANKKLLPSAATPFKVLAGGELKKKLSVKAARISKTAADAIQKAGGTIAAGK